MARFVFLFFFFMMSYFFSNAQENKSAYGLPKKNWVKTKPFITFCGKEGGEVLLDSISVESIITIKSLYTFQRLSINFGGAGFLSLVLAGYLPSTKDNVTFFKLSSFRDLIKKCQAGTKITLINIQVVKDKIIYDVPDVTYIVTKNKSV